MLKYIKLSRNWKRIIRIYQTAKIVKDFHEVIILDSFKIHILHARPKPDKDVKCPGVVPGGRQMPDPRAVIKFQMPHPRDWDMSKCPANARGGMGTAGIDWCITSDFRANLINLPKYKTVWDLVGKQCLVRLVMCQTGTRWMTRPSA